MPQILDRRAPEPEDEKERIALREQQAHLIVTAVVLGFMATRIHLGQPLGFDFEHPNDEDWPPQPAPPPREEFTSDQEHDQACKEIMAAHELSIRRGFLEPYQDFLDVMSVLSLALDANDLDPKALSDGQSQAWELGTLITGRKGGSMVSSKTRERDMKDAAAILDGLAEAIEHLSYTGPGAYTGMIDDPVNSTVFVTDTRRFAFAPSERWHCGDGVYHGLIRGNDQPVENGGMGQLPDTGGEKQVVGYVHGMCTAIRKSVDSGPWCTPYELVQGGRTTKVASCFACTTYMYATGYPPSSTHLGKGSSWIPPTQRADDAQSEGERKIVSGLNKRWHVEIYHYMRLGHRMLQRLGDNVAEPSRKAMALLVDRLDEISEENICERGGNLFLDALTVHESEWRRIRDTLQPLYSQVVAERRSILPDETIASALEATLKASK